ncbi:YjzD family protein [Cytobacillus sp. FSL W7-1323]|uniref:YjzD family protein n=1 Tax=Cytobacillus stercorigallinarum TaxID=2762240 RepID=A0ABR8QS14_9BACI|nr:MULTISPECIES: YjzD family protein [Cytobacillus]MBD7938062.1 YjzD family protein [Cytobacillus stercorigallinarum]MCM3322035.1 YjzD family protein [Cytobacillus kochii]MCM3343133.1 YjzD family protein [Cytobacillus kochii]MDQ0187022.1 CHASE2 domain-containing sensor protein [Cytobacillus kochii]MEA1851644.1 YjzD family protein [Cytobacillus sp. OWB-43]
MQYIWTFIWTFLLMNMVTYVVSNMNGVSYDLQTATVLSVVVSILLYILAAVIPAAPEEKEGLH